MLKDGDWITEHNCKVTDQCESTIDEGIACWCAA